LLTGSPARGFPSFLCSGVKGSNPLPYILLLDIRRLDSNQAWRGKSGHSFIVAGDMNLPEEHCCAILGIFVYLLVTCSSTIHRRHCCVPIATVVTRTLHSVKLYVRLLNCRNCTES
jgi:hypothetical protein